MAESKRAEVDAAIADIDFENNDYYVVFNTTKGDIKVEFYPDVAPGHCKNLIGLARVNFYDGIIFHRVIADFMAQVGCPHGTGTGGPGYTIDAEFNQIKHVPGILSMARTMDPNSAGSQIFMCVATVPHLDGQYTVFGKTADDESLKVLMGIGEVATDAGDRPLEEITINSTEIIVEPK